MLYGPTLPLFHAQTFRSLPGCILDLEILCGPKGFIKFGRILFENSLYAPFGFGKYRKSLHLSASWQVLPFVSDSALDFLIIFSAKYLVSDWIIANE